METLTQCQSLNFSELLVDHPFMDEKTVRALLGPPDQIISTDEMMKARVWKCSRCFERYELEAPGHPPDECRRCGGIAFETGRGE
jgi:hypothetical protein